MVTPTLKRVQMLLLPEQNKELAEIARAEGRSVADVTREIIKIGLRARKQENEFSRRERAMKRIEALRATMPFLEVDVAEDLRQLREERLEQITNPGR